MFLYNCDVKRGLPLLVLQADYNWILAQAEVKKHRKILVLQTGVVVYLHQSVGFATVVHNIDVVFRLDEKLGNLKKHSLTITCSGVSPPNS